MPGWPSVGTLAALLEPCFAQHTHGQLAAFVHAAVFGGDGWLADPILQPLDGFVVAAFLFSLRITSRSLAL